MFIEETKKLKRIFWGCFLISYLLGFPLFLLLEQGDIPVLVNIFLCVLFVGIAWTILIVMTRKRFLLQCDSFTQTAFTNGTIRMYIEELQACNLKKSDTSLQLQRDFMLLDGYALYGDYEQAMALCALLKQQRLSPSQRQCLYLYEADCYIGQKDYAKAGGSLYMAQQDNVRVDSYTPYFKQRRKLLDYYEGKCSGEDAMIVLQEETYDRYQSDRVWRMKQCINILFKENRMEQAEIAQKALQSIQGDYFHFQNDIREDGKSGDTL